MSPFKSLKWWFLKSIAGPIINGATVSEWYSMLEANRFKVAPRYWARAAFATLLSVNNSIAKRLEMAFYGKAIQAAAIEPPLFVLGCWRSGTTHLHNLLSKDKRFAFPNSFQVMNPHSFLLNEMWNAPLQNLFYPATRAMDNVAFAADQPQEDEFAIAIMSGVSPMMSLLFWERRHEYNRFTTFHDVRDAEIRSWKDALLLFLKKLTVKYKRRLVLKSPAHTAKIRVLLDLFPDAKFVMIHRHPYEIFASAVHMCEKNLPLTSLQIADLSDCAAEIAEHYGQLFDAYFDQRSQIPAGNLVEVSYEDLQVTPLATLKRIYETLSLPTFSDTEPAITDYVESLTGYSTNIHAPLDDESRSLINHRWRACFESWGYSNGDNGD